jgi:hypothetical protein
MPHDPILAANALRKLALSHERFVLAQEDRRQAIVEAVKADIPLRDVGEAAHCSHETIRRIVAADGQATVSFDGHEYLLAGRTVDLLVYKLAGYGNGTFADLERLNAGNEWPKAAGWLASDFQTAMSDDSGQPVVLDQERGFALHQVLRGTAKGNPSTLSELAQALGDRYGYPPY